VCRTPTSRTSWTGGRRVTPAEKRKKDNLGKRADAILARRQEKAKLAKMTPHQRAAYHKAKAAKAAAKHKAQENKTLKEAGKG
jgi:hypothetical protein